ncbi:unnamed protein product [Ceratitis capitata]|uniref:(Mediterranean fruit fly) hypothetical protein n=1 Tax=Ceratitis capitata TaxID=7213 RepID=A0A811U207_CERCA|nr:unnamed protein product [Ceratitis capitata]
MENMSCGNLEMGEKPPNFGLKKHIPETSAQNEEIKELQYLPHQRGHQQAATIKERAIKSTV